MRPPANIVRQWMKEKNSFPVRGLVMLHQPERGWLCNIEILRVSREQLAEMPQDEAAFEIALSAVFRYITSVVYTGESVPITTARGSELLVPKIAFEMAPFMVDKVKKILAEGGGGVNLAQVALTQKFLARSTTGNAKDAEGYGLPKVVTGAVRVKHRLDYEARLTAQQMKAMMRRRKLLARHWLRRTKKGSFLQRGLAFSSDPHGFWAFNVRPGHEMVEHTSDDRQALERMALEVSLEAVYEYTRAEDYDRDGVTYLRKSQSTVAGVERVPPDVAGAAARRVATKLLAQMGKHKHGVLSHKVIENSLVLAWDPEDDKPMDEYPFPLAPTVNYIEMDRRALDQIEEAFKKNRLRNAETDAQPDGLQSEKNQDTSIDPSAQSSWREELEIADWVPLDEPEEDDETIDRKALEKADHDQSAALRRIRGNAGGRILPDDSASPVQHKVDYAGLPKDEG